MSVSSGSVTVAEQLKVSLLYADVVGEMDMSLSVGAVFSTVTLASEVMLSPSESVAVAVQMIVSPTLVSEAETVYVPEVETSFVPTIQE